MKECAVCGSTFLVKRVHRKGELYCNRHQLQMRRHGRILPDTSEIVEEDSYARVMLYDVKRNIIGEVIIDKEDCHLVRDYRWTKNGYGYATARSKGMCIWMHRLVVGLPPINIRVDHINRNSSDNRKSNLRLCEQCENARNTSISKNNKSGFSGIWRNNERDCWTAEIKNNYKKIHLLHAKDIEFAFLTRKVAELIFFQDFRPITLREDVDTMKYEELKQKHGYENVYAIKRESVLDIGEGFVKYEKSILKHLTTKGFFIRRYDAEYNPQYKQIIPYVVLRHGAKLFVTQRLESASGDKRLFGKLSIGHSGHINEIDQMQIGNLLANCVVRELTEELQIYNNAKPNARYLGFINDNSNEVGRDHLGVAVLIDLSKPMVEVKETEKMVGKWEEIESLKAQYDNLESWSQIVLDALIERTSANGS